MDPTLSSFLIYTRGLATQRLHDLQQVGSFCPLAILRRLQSGVDAHLGWGGVQEHTCLTSTLGPYRAFSTPLAGIYIYIYIIQRRVGYPVLHTLWRLPKLSKTLPGHELLRRLFFWVELLHVTHAPHAVKVRTALDSFFDLRKLFLKALGHTMPKEFGIVLASLEVSPSTHTLESSMVDIPQSIAWHMHTLIGITCIALHFYLAA